MVINLRILIFFLISIVLCTLMLKQNFVIGSLIIILFYTCFAELLKTFFKSGRIAIFNAKNQFLLHYFLIHGIGYYAYLIRSELSLNNYTFDDNIIIKSITYSILGVIVYQLSYKYIYNKVKKSCFNFANFSVKRLYPSPTYKWILLFIAIIGGAAVFWRSIGTIPMLISDYNSSARAELGKGLGYLEALNFSLINLSLLFFIQVVKKRNYNWDTFVYLLSIIFIFILNADRGSMIYYLLTLWFIYSIYNGQPTLKQFSYFAVGLVLLAGILGVMKSSNRSNLLLSGTIILTEVAVEFDNYNEVFNMVEKEGYCGGSTLVPIFTLPVPRTILPDKDKFLTAGNYFKEYHNHSHIRVGERISYIGEFFLNFGLPGIIIGMIVIGCMVGFLDKSMNPMSTLSVYLYMQLVIMTSSVGGDIPTAFITFVMRNFLPIGVTILFYLFFNKKRKCYT